MSKRVFIIHGWDGHPQEGWFPWLKQEFEAKGFEVEVPAMPETDNPKIDVWVSQLAAAVGTPDEQTFFIGHSIGCQTILRYLESLDSQVKVGGCVFVAGWFSLMNLEIEEEQEIATPWLETPIDFEKVKAHTNKFTAIFSDNDPVVPQDNKHTFEKHLQAKVIVEHAKGHFSGSDKINELPSALNSILEFVR